MSHGPTAARHTVPTASNVVLGHILERPLHSRHCCAHMCAARTCSTAPRHTGRQPCDTVRPWVGTRRSDTRQSILMGAITTCNHVHTKHTHAPVQYSGTSHSAPLAAARQIVALDLNTSTGHVGDELCALQVRTDVCARVRTHPVQYSFVSHCVRDQHPLLHDCTTNVPDQLQQRTGCRC
jgi:hypothetical protein